MRLYFSFESTINNQDSNFLRVKPSMADKSGLLLGEPLSVGIQKTHTELNGFVFLCVLCGSSERERTGVTSSFLYYKSFVLRASAVLARACTA